MGVEEPGFRVGGDIRPVETDHVQARLVDEPGQCPADVSASSALATYQPSRSVRCLTLAPAACGAERMPEAPRTHRDGEKRNPR